MKTAAKLYRFDRNELDLAGYELRRAGRRLPLSGKPMELLILLIERRGQLVRREEIVTNLWPDAASLDVEQGINALVKRIRGVLNDDADKPRFIETVIGKGYRFIAEVEEIGMPVASAVKVEAIADVPIAVQNHVPTIEASVAHPASKPRSFRWRIGLAAALIVALVGLIWYGTSRWRQRVDEHRGATFHQVTSLIPENRATAAAISPNGNLVVYANADGIFIQTSNGETTALRAPPNFVVDHLAWFASGTKVLASGFSEVTSIPAIWTIYLTGSPPRFVRDMVRRGVPSPDETRIACISQDRSEIWTVGANGEDPERVLNGPDRDTFPLIFWSADARRLDFQRRHYAPERRNPNFPSAETQFDAYYERSYESLDLTTRKIVARTPDMWIESAAALTDGRIVFLRWNPPGALSLQLWEVETDRVTGAFLEPPRKLESFPEKDDRLHMSGMSASADGKQILVVRRSDQYAVFVGDLSTNPLRIVNPRRLTLDDQTDFPHAWTPDSRAVIFESNRYGNNYNIFKQYVDKRTAEPIVVTQLPEVLPQVTPDGRWVLYRTWAQGERYRNSKLMRVPLEGGTPEQVPIGEPLDEFCCAPLKGARCVLRTTVPGQYYSFYDLDPVRGKGRELARAKWEPGVLGDWTISPDGRELAFPEHNSRDARIRIVNLQRQLEGAIENNVTAQGLANLSSLHFSVDGKGWFVSVETTVGNRLFYVYRDGASHSLGDIPGWVVPSPDGRRVAFLNQIVAANAWQIDRQSN